MHYGIWSCVPILVLIIGVFATKRMTEMVIISSLIGSVIIYHQHFFTGFVDLIYEVLSDDTYQFALILIMCVGGMMKIFERSGALAGFQEKLGRFADSPRKSLLITWLLTIIMFIDDYLILLVVSGSMRNVTDKNRVPREHLAYTLNSMGVSVCLLVPITSWSVFAIANMKKLGLEFTDYLHAIPFMFFSAASVVISLLLIIGVLPKTGYMKKAYQRVEEGGSVLPPEEPGTAGIVSAEPDDQSDVRAVSLLNFFIPLICLVLYKAQRIITVGEYFEAFFDGMRGMSSIAFIVLFAYMIAKENEIMEFAPFIVENSVKIISPGMLPCFIFVIMSVVAFTIGDVWALVLITMPIFIPMAQRIGLSESVAVGALLSGANFGAIMCMQSDALFMTYAGTGVPNVTQIKAGLPYVAMAFGVSCIGYLITGFLL